jgi:hypothetical protein
MPIRFRCSHCHQLMGIARRKSGTEVQCPTCRQNVVVPKEDEVEATSAPQPRAAAEPGKPASGTGAGKIFEHSNFDEVLRNPEPPPRAVRSAPKNGSAGARNISPDRGPTSASGGPAGISQGGMTGSNGILLTSNQATMLAVVGIVLLAVAFGAGLLVGRYCFGG